MKCPVCDETLREVQKHGVNVDICPGCKGIWLDRGELEKIIDMVATDGPISETRNDQSIPQRFSEELRRSSRDHDDNREYHEKRDHDEHSREQGYGQRKKKNSWLGDILGGFGGGDD